MGPAEIRIGTSGWNYWHWKGVFYPESLPRERWLVYYQSKFNTVELNASFYHAPRFSTSARWREASPPGFLWAVKAHRSITHFSRLAEREPLEKFLGSLEGLGESLGAVLFQLPPSLKFDFQLASRFFGWLPEGKRYAVEPRHGTWLDESALNLLVKHGIALCMADSGGRFPSAEHRTGEFVYVRFHGGERLYASRYPVREICRWADKLKEWNCPAFLYFNNDFHGYAVENAGELQQALLESGMGGVPGRSRSARGSRR